MVDGAAATGQAVLQLLPVNDTTSTKTWTDSYPYGGITIMALHPIYLNLQDIGPLRNKEAQAAFEAEAAELKQLFLRDFADARQDERRLRTAEQLCFPSPVGERRFG